MKLAGAWILIGGICIGMLSACAKIPPVETKETKPNTGEAGDELPVDPEKISRVILDYDMFSGEQFRLRATVTGFSEKGSELEIEKGVGPENSTGFRKEGKLGLGAKKTDELKEILGRYDIKGYSRLPSRGSSTAPSRSLWVFEGNERYVVSFDAKFPKTVPPEEDIMYFELFNFFNDIIYDEPGWEEVRSDDLPDPRKNPAYGERTVTHFGQTVRLVPGTGTVYEDGRGAEIDYGDRIWWLEEGFTGTWEYATEEDRDYVKKTAEDASFTVREDGSALLRLDDAEWAGTLGEKRYYKTGIGIVFEHDGKRRVCSIKPVREDSYRSLELSCYPGPVPETQFDPIDVHLSQPGWQLPGKTAAAAGDEKGKEGESMNSSSLIDWICRNCGAENSGMFCRKCGASPAESAPLLKEKWPEDGHYPTLSEVRNKEEKHGVLTEVNWSGGDSGMMVGSVSSYSLHLSREDGELRLVSKSMPTFEPVTIRVYSVDEEVFEKIEKFIEEENLAAWSYLRVDPEKKMMVYDYSSHSGITLTYDDSSLGGWKWVPRSVDREAAEQQGGAEVFDAFVKMLRECTSDPGCLLSETTEENPYMKGLPNGGFAGMGPSGTAEGGSAPGETDENGYVIAADGSWTCKECGMKGLTGKFCSECGARGPR